MEILIVLWFLGFIVGIVTLLVNLIRKRSKKKATILTAGSLIILLVAGYFIPATATLDIEAAEIETNEKGVALVEGTTNAEATLTVDGKNLDNKEGDFSYEVKLGDQTAKKITLVATIEESEVEQIVTVTPSEEYITFLNEQKIEEEKLKKVETALALAEKEPNQKNYDEATTLISALTKEYDTIDDRLTSIEDYIKAEAAVALAEKELTSGSLDKAQSLIKKIVLNEDAFSDRIKTIQTNVIEKEEQLASAKEAVDLAEKSPTDDNYTHAFELIEALPSKDNTLNTRLVAVNSTIEKDKEEQAATLAAEKAKQEKLASENAAKEKVATEQAAQSAAVQTTPSVEVPNESNEQIVMVTATGSKYHTHKCGNGTYYDAPMSVALSRGLTPCSKCY